MCRGGVARSVRVCKVSSQIQELDGPSKERVYEGKRGRRSLHKEGGREPHADAPTLEEPALRTSPLESTLSSPRHDQNSWSSSFCLFPRTLFGRSQHLRDARLPPGVRESSATGAIEERNDAQRDATRLHQDRTRPKYATRHYELSSFNTVQKGVLTEVREPVFFLRLSDSCLILAAVWSTPRRSCSCPCASQHKMNVQHEGRMISRGQRVRTRVEESARTRQDSPEGSRPRRERPTHHSRCSASSPRPSTIGLLSSLHWHFARRESWNVICCLLASGESLVLREYPSDESHRVLLRRIS